MIKENMTTIRRQLWALDKAKERERTLLEWELDNLNTLKNKENKGLYDTVMGYHRKEA